MARPRGVSRSCSGLHGSTLRAMRSHPLPTLVLLVGSALGAVACGDDEGGGAGGQGGGATGSTSGEGAATGASGTTSNAASSSTGDGGAGQGGEGSGAGPGQGGAGAGGSGTGAGSPGCGVAPTAGTTGETLDVAGVARTYVMAIPEGITGTTGVPLILGFHGFGGTGEAASSYFGLTGTEAAIYVYPQALPLPDQDGGIGWDMRADGVDVAFVDALVAHLQETQCIDPSRVFAAGHSHGASFSNHLGCYRPALFRAIAPVAGGGPWAGECTGSVSAMLTHGSADGDVPIQNGIDSRDHWLEANGCAGAASSPTEPAPCVVYEGCAEPVLWCEHGGGHEWPDFAGAGIRGFFLGL